jgi:hypothetical protein
MRQNRIEIVRYDKNAEFGGGFDIAFARIAK